MLNTLSMPMSYTYPIQFKPNLFARQMKKTLLYLVVIALFIDQAFAQKKDKKRDYHLDRDIYAFNVSHTGNLSYSPIGEPAISSSGGLMICPGRFDWIMPDEGQYGYSEGSGLLSSVLGVPIPTAGFLEMGYGWMFNNNKTKSKSRYVSIQYGMGIGFGFRQFWVEPQNTGTLYGVLWPEFSGIISIGNRLEIVPKFIFNPLYSGKEWGLRTGTEAMFIYRAAGPLSVTCRLVRERINFNEKWETDGKGFSGIAKTGSMQLGIAINVAN